MGKIYSPLKNEALFSWLLLAWTQFRFGFSSEKLTTNVTRMYRKNMSKTLTCTHVHSNHKTWI